ncbi:MAG: GNAT family N-acetyltransferase [Hyphomicrobiales bacterium]|nr:GNAT family N-acetyltransferase [Hyphomicrobiales bacterium]
MNVTELETERLKLRGWRESDLGPLAAFYADEESARFLGGVRERDIVWRALAAYVGHWGLRGYGFWALEEKTTGDFAGWCGLWFPEGWPEPEIGWGLMPAARGKGYATEAARRARQFAYGELGWTTAISFIDAKNNASRAVAERLGARPDGEMELFGNPAIIFRHPAPNEI